MKKYLVSALAAALCFTSTFALAYSPTDAVPTDIDLSNWNRTLPVDKAGKTSGEAVEIAAKGSFPAGLPLVFKASVDGAHTSGSKYPRDELREMKGSDKAAWSLATGGTMTATLSVDSVPIQKDGHAGKIEMGQIHGSKDELVRLYWDAGHIYFHNDVSGSDGKEHQFELLNASGKAAASGIGDKISELIDAHDKTLTVKVWANGDVYSYVGPILDVWQKEKGLYFKAGVYDGNNAAQGATGYGQTSFYALDFSHVAGQGLGGLQVQPTTLRAPQAIAADMQKLVDELNTLH